MSRRSELRMLDIIDAIDRIADYVEGQGYQGFLDDMKTQDAVARNIEIIGEATRSLPQAFRLKHADVPWKEIVAMRNIVIHEYFGVMPDVVWDVIENELPKLKRNIKNILDAGNLDDSE